MIFKHYIDGKFFRTEADTEYRDFRGRQAYGDPNDTIMFMERRGTIHQAFLKKDKLHLVIRRKDHFHPHSLPHVSLVELKEKHNKEFLAKLEVSETDIRNLEERVIKTFVNLGDLRDVLVGIDPDKKFSDHATASRERIIRYNEKVV